MSVAAPGLRAGLRLRRSICVCSVAAALALGACSSDSSRFDGFGYSSDTSSDGMVTSSLPPVPSEPVYAGRMMPPVAQASVQPQPAYPPAPQYASAPLSTSEPPRVVRTAMVPPIQSSPQPTIAPIPAVYRPQPEPIPAPPPAPVKEVTVTQGDTLSAIARRHGSTVDDIMIANGMTDTKLSLGQVLKVPAAGEASTALARTHKVRDGESIYIIADRYNVGYKELAKFNGLSRPDLIRPGQELRIPASGAEPPAQVAAKPRSDGVRIVRTRTIPVTPVAEEPEPIRVASAGPTVPLPQSSPRRPEAPAVKRDAPDKPVQTARLTQPKPMTGTEFRWPVRGRVISKFGPKPNGKHNDGINVAVPAGTSVKAAENGVVAYAGNELEGYGNLVLVRHSDGWVSAYAHNEELLVKRGDTVRRGQIIAKAGQSGSVSQPQVHFELRKGSKPVDPLAHMAEM